MLRGPLKTLVLAMAIAAVAQTTAAAQVLTAGGVSIDAPAGYTLTTTASGSFLLSSDTRRVTFVRVQSGQPLAGVGAAVYAAVTTHDSPPTTTADSYSFTMAESGSRYQVLVKPAAGAGSAAGQFDVLRVGARTADAAPGPAGPATKTKTPARCRGRIVKVKGKAAKCVLKKVVKKVVKKPVRKSHAIDGAFRPPDTTELTDVLGLLGKRTAQPVVPAGLPLPMRDCQAPGAHAQVIDIPGVGCDGAKGSFLWGADGYGSVHLGQPFLVNTPANQFPSGPIVATWSSPAQAFADVWPQELKDYSGVTATVTSVTPIPGTENFIPGSPSGLVSFHATVTGAKTVEVDGIALSAYIDSFNGGVTWNWYSSVIAVFKGAPPGTGNALMTTWQSLDASAGIRDRLAAIAETIRTTQAPGGPIDPTVFQRTVDNFGAYLNS